VQKQTIKNIKQQNPHQYIKKISKTARHSKLSTS